MQWMNPAGAWALAALLVIVGLYMLKQRMEPLEVSSTYLWEKALASLEADRPLQKLKRSLPLFLQLALALLLAVALMRPMSIGSVSGEVILVFDLSASMQADDGNGSRMEHAVADAMGRLDGLSSGARISILTAGAHVGQPLSRSDDAFAAKRVLSGLASENGTGDTEGALSLAYALQKELPDAQLIFYSDLPLPEGVGIQPYIGAGLDNQAVLSLRASGTTAVARVANYGSARKLTLECESDGVLCDVKIIALSEGEIASVQFDLPTAAEEVHTRIVEKDALLGDNSRIWTSRESGATLVILAGRDNIFIEKALALRPDISLLKTTPEEASQIGGGAVTVLDGHLPEALPEKGALLLIDPDRNMLPQRNTSASLSASSGELANRLNAFLSVSDIRVARWKPLEGGTPIWLAEGETILSIYEQNNRKTAVIGFDIHDSNLPLLKEFPIFVQGLLSYLAPEPLGIGFEEAECGRELTIQPQSATCSAAVEAPSGKRIPISLPSDRLTDTNELGVYRLLQTDEDGKETVLPFALHIPVQESDVRTVAMERGADAATGGKGRTYGQEWTPLVILLLLMGMLLEWWVYRRGY